MLELDGMRLKYEMRANTRCHNHHGKLFGRLALASSRRLKSGMRFHKLGFQSDRNYYRANLQTHIRI